MRSRRKDAEKESTASARSPFLVCSKASCERCLARGELFGLEKGTPFIREGEAWHGVIELRKGVLKLMRNILPGRNSTLLYIREGELLGLGPMLHQRPFPYSVVPATDVELVRYPEADIRELMEAEPEFQLKLIRDLCSRLKTLEKKQEGILLKSTAQRLSDHILHLKELGNIEGSEEFEFHLEEAADHIGTTPDYLHKVIIELSKDGIVELQKRRLRIQDIEGLKKLSEGG